MLFVGDGDDRSYLTASPDKRRYIATLDPCPIWLEFWRTQRLVKKASFGGEEWAA